MRKIGLALASAFLIVATSNLKAQEMPFGFGIKGGFLNSNLTGLDKAQGTWDDKSESPLFNPSYQGGLFGEYVFHDYVGAGLDVVYGRMHDSIHKKGDEKKNVSVNIHQVSILPMVKIYPMGRDIDSGILNIHVGPEFILPLMTDASKDDKEAKDLIKKDDLNSYNLAAFGGVGYEFPVGLLLEARGSYGFMDVFTEKSTFKTETKIEAKKALGLAENDQVKPWYVNVSLGYNFARLLEE